MPNKTSLTLNIQLTGARETIKAFRGLPKEFQDGIRDGAGKISEDMATWVRGALLADTRQSAVLADTVKVNRDRVPSITVGGAKRVTSSGAKAYQLLFGANFGATTYRRPGRVPFFEHDHAGPGNDYVIWKTYLEHQGEVDERWNAVADEALAAWAAAQALPGDEG